MEQKYEFNSVVQEGRGGSLSTGKVPQRPKREHKRANIFNLLFPYISTIPWKSMKNK